MRYELTDYEWTAIRPMLPNKPRSNRSESDLLQPVSLPRSQSGRTVLQQDQTMPSNSDALR